MIWCLINGESKVKKHKSRENRETMSRRDFETEKTTGEREMTYSGFLCSLRNTVKKEKSSALNKSIILWEI